MTPFRCAPADGWRAAFVMVRSPVQPQMIARMLRGAVAELDPSVPVTVETLRERAGTLTVTPRFDALLLGGFAGVEHEGPAVQLQRLGRCPSDPFGCPFDVG